MLVTCSRGVRVKVRVGEGAQTLNTKHLTLITLNQVLVTCSRNVAVESIAQKLERSKPLAILSP